MATIYPTTETLSVKDIVTDQSSIAEHQGSQTVTDVLARLAVIGVDADRSSPIQKLPDSLDLEIPAHQTRTPIDIEITKATKDNGYLSKKITLLDGEPCSDSSDCRMARGRGERVRFKNLEEVAHFISGLDSSSALILGRIRAGVADSVSLVSQHLNTSRDNLTISRTQENFAYSAEKQALLLIDFDTKGMPDEIKKRIVSHGSVEKILDSVFPEFARAAKITRNSTSSGLFNQETGQQYDRTGGVHIYVCVVDGSDIPRALKNIFKRLWIAGFGWIYVSESCRLLVRSIVDQAVSGPERLCFEGKPNIEPPLAQHPRPCKVVHGQILDTREVFPDLTLDQEKKYQELVAVAKAALEPGLVFLRKEKIEKEVSETVARGIDRVRAQKDAERKYHSNNELIELGPTQMLIFDDPSLANRTVEEVLSNPALYHEKTLADPVEPHDSRGNIVRNKAILYVANNRITIYSHKHGGMNYTLLHDASSIEKIIIEGKRNDLKFSQVIIKAMLMTGRNGLSEIETDSLFTKASKHIGCGKKSFQAEFNRERKKYASHAVGSTNLTTLDGNMAIDGEASDKILLEHPEDYTKTADIFLSKQYTDTQGDKTILYAGQQYFIYNGDCYEPVPEKSELIQGQVWSFARKECCVENDSDVGTEPKPYLPSTSIQRNICSALKSLIGRKEPLDPTWLDGREDQDIGYLLVLENGILNLKTGELQQKTPNLFVLSSASYAYDPTATCPVFDELLISLKLDQESINLIEEMLGYALINDRSYQKILIIFGPPRSGKGTLLRLFDLLTNSYISVSLRMMDGDFAFQSAIGKKVLAIPDARKGFKVDMTAINEAFLSISGGDKQSINRKNLPFWTGYLNTLIIFAANELLDFKDTSAALASRMVVLNLTESFLGKEDLNLTEKLASERSGILNRAIKGLNRLQARGGFLQPEASKSRLAAQINKNDPNRAFIDELCTLAPNLVVETSALYEVYIRFAAANKISRYHSNIGFSRDFLSLYNIYTREARQNERESLKITKSRQRVYVGLQLKPDWQERLKDMEGGVTFSLADVPF